MRAFLLSVVCLLGCAKKEQPHVQQACTLETPLKAGVPGSPGHLMVSERNPNGASELATHMRTMVEDLTVARSNLQSGKPLPLLHEKHSKIRCAWPTDPKDRNQAFDGMAQNYLAAVAEMDAKPADVRGAYARVVRACRTCHEATCDGPIAVIDQLALDGN